MHLVKNFFESVTSHVGHVATIPGKKTRVTPIPVVGRLDGMCNGKLQNNEPKNKKHSQTPNFPKSKKVWRPSKRHHHGDGTNNGSSFFNVFVFHSNHCWCCCSCCCCNSKSKSKSSSKAMDTDVTIQRTEIEKVQSIGRRKQ